MADASRPNPATQASGDPSVAALVHFVDYYEFLVAWARKAAGWNKADAAGFALELEYDIERRFLDPAWAAQSVRPAGGQGDEPSTSLFLDGAIARTLPRWFLKRVTHLRDWSACYQFPTPGAEPEELGRLGRCRVVRVVGKGGMGLVFEATVPRERIPGSLVRQDDSERVAVKLILPEKRSPEFERRFITEAEVLHALNKAGNPNIVEFVEAARAGGDEGDPYLAMRYADGLTLHDLIHHFGPGRAPRPLVVDLIRQVANGLRTVHATPTIEAHRDLKPANVLLERVADNVLFESGWRVRICDVGLAKIVSASGGSASGVVVGTKGYRAPEQVRGVGVDGKSDIFALGIIAYEMVAGAKPFDGSEVFPQPVRAFPKDVPARLRRCVARMLEMEGDDRPDAAEVLNELRDIAGGLEKPAPRGRGASAPVRPAPLVPVPSIPEIPDRAEPGADPGNEFQRYRAQVVARLAESLGRLKEPARTLVEQHVLDCRSARYAKRNAPTPVPASDLAAVIVDQCPSGGVLSKFNDLLLDELKGDAEAKKILDGTVRWFLPLNYNPKALKEFLTRARGGSAMAMGAASTLAIAELLMAGVSGKEARFATAANSVELAGQLALRWEQPPVFGPSDPGREEVPVLRNAIGLIRQMLSVAQTPTSKWKPIGHQARGGGPARHGGEGSVLEAEFRELVQRLGSCLDKTALLPRVARPAYCVMELPSDKAGRAFACLVLERIRREVPRLHFVEILREKIPDELTLTELLLEHLDLVKDPHA